MSGAPVWDIDQWGSVPEVSNPGGTFKRCRCLSEMTCIREDAKTLANESAEIELEGPYDASLTNDVGYILDGSIECLQLCKRQKDACQGKYMPRRARLT